MARIIGNTTATPYPRPDWEQMEEGKADYIKNKPNIEKIVTDHTIYTNNEPLLEDFGGILVNNHKEGFNNVPINDLITELLYPYREPVISSFSLTPPAGVQEKNKELKVTKATVTVTKKSKSIASVGLYKGHVLIKEITDNVESGGTFDFELEEETLDGSEDTSYQIKVVEAGEGGSTIISSKQTYSFVYPYFYGVISNETAVNSETILKFTPVIRAKGTHSYSYTTDNQCPVIAYPKSYGVIGSIIDPNNFSQDWTRHDITIDGVDYYVYVGDPSTATAKYTFNY